MMAPPPLAVIPVVIVPLSLLAMLLTALLAWPLAGLRRWWVTCCRWRNRQLFASAVRDLRRADHRLRASRSDESKQQDRRLHLPHRG